MSFTNKQITISLMWCLMVVASCSSNIACGEMFNLELIVVALGTHCAQDTSSSLLPIVGYATPQRREQGHKGYLLAEDHHILLSHQRAQQIQK